MTPFDWIVIIGGICGLFMVIGGMILLYKGNITLNKTSKDEAVTLEFRKMIKITTHYPALGLFVIGLAFIIVSAVFAKPKEVTSLAIKGHVNVDDPSSVTFFVYTGHGGLPRLTDREIDEIVYPHLKILKVDITAPGYSPPTITKTIGSSDIKKGIASLGEITFTNKKAEKPQTNPDNIKPVKEELPPLSAGGKF